MILKSLYFDLNRNEYPDEYGYDLLLKSRYYCNYIERTVFKPLKWKTLDFDRISIKFSDTATTPTYDVNSFKVLCITAKFDKKEYEQAANSNVADFFIANIERILPSIATDEINLPITEIRNANKQFVLDGYINKWLYEKKNNKDLKTTAFLYCELTVEAFKLTLQIMRENNLVYDKVILVEDPDPVAYHYKFKDIVFTDHSVIITHKLSFGNLIEVNINKLKNETT